MKTGQRVEEVSIGRWFYTKPDFIPDENGNIVLISKKSFGPLEVYEWGIDSDEKVYELYRWLENDFFEDCSYCKYIEREKLLEQLHTVISLFQNNELPEWADFYEKVVVHLNAGHLISSQNDMC
ncbi:MAG: hypothetical protein K2K74_10530 [Lachnospiraceae bacterium]|nr:hypothetical protein [Lachnospiraceae bacterium]